MTTTTPQLVLPDGTPITRALSGDGRAARLGFSVHSWSAMDVRGAQVKAQDWRLLFDMYRRHPIVRAAVDKIVKVCTNTGFEFVPRDSRRKVKQSEYKRAKEFFDRQHDFIGELRRVYQDLLIFGDAYLYVVYDRRRQPMKLKRVAPWTMHVKAKRNGEIEYFVQRDPDDPKADAVVFQTREILHFRLPNPTDDIYGLSPLESLKTTVTTDLAAMTWNKNFFMNGASTGTIIMVEDATEEEVMRAREYIKQAYSGPENAHTPLIITGKTRVEKSISTHSEMGFLDGRQYLKGEILAVLDVPPAKIGEMGSANRSNSKEQDKTFKNESVSPLQYVVESVVNDQFLRAILDIKDTIFQHSESDVRDAQEQMDLWKNAVQNGLMNINEVRSLMGLASVPGGDINYVMTPTGAVPVVDLELYFKIPETNVDTVPPQDGQGFADGEEGTGTRGPVPPSTVNVQTETRPATKAYARALWADALERLDAADEHDDDLVGAVAALEKAVKTDDEDRRLAYLERGTALLWRSAQQETTP